MGARVQAEIDGAARADEQQFGLVRVLPHVEDKFVVRQPVVIVVQCWPKSVVLKIYGLKSSSM